jgi:hypothetical protein
VQHDWLPRRERLEDGERVLLGCPAMDDESLAKLGRELGLSAEQFALAVSRRVVPVVVEPGLAHRDRTSVYEKRA